MKSLIQYINESMSDAKMKAIGRLLSKIKDKEINSPKELDKLMKTLNCRRITDEVTLDNNDFKAGYSNGKYTFTVFISNNKISNFTNI